MPVPPIRDRVASWPQSQRLCPSHTFDMIDDWQTNASARRRLYAALIENAIGNITAVVMRGCSRPQVQPYHTHEYVAATERTMISCVVSQCLEPVIGHL